MVLLMSCQDSQVRWYPRTLQRFRHLCRWYLHLPWHVLRPLWHTQATHPWRGCWSYSFFHPWMGSDSHSPSKDERKSNSSILSRDEWLECVIEAEVHATVDEDTNGRDAKTSVKSLDTIGLESLDIDINKTIELSFTSFALGIISKPGSGVVQRVDKQQGKSSCKSSTGNVGSKLQSLRSILGGLEQALDLILEGKVQSLSWEVSQHIGKITSPERVNSLSLQDPHCTVDNTSVWLVKTSLLDHLILVLDEKLNSLDGSSSSL